MEIKIVPRESNSWFTPPLRFINAPPIDFVCSSRRTERSGQLRRQCVLVNNFTQACILCLKLTRLVAPALYNIDLYVVRQNFVVVCQRFWEWMGRKQVDEPTDTFKESRDDLNEARGHLWNILLEHWPADSLLASSAPDRGKEWLVMSIHYPIFAAFASQYERISDFKEFVCQYETALGPLTEARLHNLAICSTSVRMGVQLGSGGGGKSR